MSRASDTAKGAAESYAGVVRQRPSGGVPRKRLRPLATFGGRMHPSDWSRLLTERQREVLSIVVENKVYRNRDSKIPELAARWALRRRPSPSNFSNSRRPVCRKASSPHRNKASGSTNRPRANRRRNKNRPAMVSDG